MEWKSKHMSLTSFPDLSQILYLKSQVIEIQYNILVLNICSELGWTVMEKNEEKEKNLTFFFHYPKSFANPTTTDNV